MGVVARIQRRPSTAFYTAKTLLYTPIQLTHIVPHDCSRMQRIQLYTVYSYTRYTLYIAIQHPSDLDGEL